MVVMGAAAVGGGRVVTGTDAVVRLLTKGRRVVPGGRRVVGILVVAGAAVVTVAVVVKNGTEDRP